MVVALGAISAGLGLFLDTLLVFSYSNADATKFQVRRALLPLFHARI